MLQHMVGEKAAIEHRLGNMSQELQNEAAVKETLQLKLERLYSTLKEQTNDKEGLDRIFGDVMNENS